ncbi:conjugal transfer protein TrbD [Escherichia coli]
MNMRNIHVLSSSVPDKRISDDFMHAVLSNCTIRIVLSALEKFSPELLPHNFDLAAVGVMKKGMSMSLFSSPGNTAIFGQTCAGKTNLMAEFISSVVVSNKKGEGQ